MSDQAITAKLRELEREYDPLRGRIRLCQSSDGETIRKTCQELLKRYEESEHLLLERAEGSRSPIAAALSKTELEYSKQMDELIIAYVPAGAEGGASDGPNQAEALALYAEYAVDHAIQAARRAQLAALSAIGVQLEYER